MRRVACSFGALLVLSTSVLVASCGPTEASEIALAMSAPQGLLDDATKMVLQVFDGKGKTCDVATGRPSEIPAEPKSFNLSKEGCAGGAWCGEVTLDQDGSTQMFHVIASNTTGTIAEGCATAKIDQDPVEVSIKVVAYVAAGCCNDAKLQTGEWCEAKTAVGDCAGITADEVCAADCTANEISLDRKEGAPSPVAGTKSNLALAFSGGSNDPAGELRTVFEDRAAGAEGGKDVQVRILNHELYSLTSPPVLSSPLRIPFRCSDPGGPGAPRQQTSPSISRLGDDAALVTYLADTVAVNQFNLFSQTLGEAGCSDDATPLQVNMTANGVSDPDVAAGATGEALVVWAQSGAVRGRVFSNGTYGTEILIANAGKTPRVAGTAGGYVVVYQAGGAGEDDVFVKTVSSTGTLGNEIRVNAQTAGVQDQPEIGVLADGRFAVAFRSGGDVYLQRYSATGTANAGDQDDPLHADTAGEQANPAVAGLDVSDMFIVVWEEQSSGAIGGRLLGGTSGLVFNPINGQNTDFIASSSVAGSRRRPTLAVGGYVALGWQDENAAHAGVYVRRLPLPVAQ